MTCRDRPWLAVVDYGAGNLRSLGGALDRVGARWRLASTAAALEGAAAMILPGVGAAGPAMRALADRGLVEPLVEGEAPLLGICLGMQVLCEHSSEGGGEVAGLGLVPGVVEPLPRDVKRPHMGWNEVRPAAAADARVPAGWYYFAHSYAARCDEADVLAWTGYGGRRIAVAIGRGRAWGVQFHPEKSAGAGLGLLGAFWRRVEAAAGARS